MSTSTTTVAELSDSPSLTSGPVTSRRDHLVAVLVYLLGSLGLWWQVWVSGSPSQTVTGIGGDAVEQVWWMQWLPWAVLHGHNPFLTNAMFSRTGGISAMANTSWMTVSAALSPVTLLFGPITSSHLADLLAPVLSAWAAFALCGRLTRLRWARIVAGGLYGFSPFVLNNTVLGHVNLTLIAYLPLMVLVLCRMAEGRTSPTRAGVQLAGLTIAEYFLGSEVLAISLITLTIGTVMVVLVDRPLARRLRVAALRATVVGGTISAVVLAYPIWLFLFGPQAVQGPQWPVSDVPFSFLLFAQGQPFNPSVSQTEVGYAGPVGPGPSYLGVALVLVLVLSAPWWWRRRAAAVAALSGLALWLLEIAPKSLWSKLPLVMDINTKRFVLAISLCAALCLAAAIDVGWAAASELPSRWSAHRRVVVSRGLTIAAVLAALAPIAFYVTAPFSVQPLNTPAFYLRDAASIPKGSVVVSFPFPYLLEDNTMEWQAVDRFSFDIAGGFGFIPGGDGTHDQFVSPDHGPIATLLVPFSHHPLQLSSSGERKLRALLEYWAPATVVALSREAAPGTDAELTATLGVAPKLLDGAWVFQINGPQDLGRPRSPTAAMRCAEAHLGEVSLAAARCVLSTPAT